MAMDWDKLRVFHAVAEAGSFTHAGEALNLSQSAVSRQISALEESLSVPLFHRHARGLILTEQGELLFRTAREVFAKLAMSESLISESKDRPKGPLKITTTVAFGSIWLTPRIREFLDLYPEIQVSLVVDDSELDLSMREADVAIRMSPPRQPDLIQRHLVSVQVHIYGTQDYLKKHGTPQRPEDLDEHRLIVYGEDSRPPVPGRQLAARCRRQARPRPPADPDGQQHLRHAARGEERAGACLAARFRRGRAQRIDARPAGDRRAAERGVFRLKLKRRMGTLRVGDPLDKNTDVGAINSREQLERIEELVESGREEGAEVYQPPCRLPEKGWWFPPTVFTNVAQSYRIAQEEIFGPVLSVLTFRTPDEAVEKANNTPYGLSAGVWTEKGSRILSLAQRLRAGVIWANTYNRFDPASPFGGYKESGFGREGGLHGLGPYLEFDE